MRRVKRNRVVVVITLFLMWVTRCLIRFLLILNSSLEKIVSYKRKKYRVHMKIGIPMESAAKLIQAASIKKCEIGDIVKELL
tara:strand:+ start:352 stop:597 length:246 start_codon:yes stop_codon:yes gene_type:complete